MKKPVKIIIAMLRLAIFPLIPLLMINGGVMERPIAITFIMPAVTFVPSALPEAAIGNRLKYLFPIIRMAE